MRPRRARPATSDELAETYRTMSRGGRAKLLTSMEVWKRDIVPFVEEQDLEILKQKSFDPMKDVPSLERIALTSAYFTGKRDGLKVLLDEIHTWIEQGRQAEARVEENNKLKQRGTQ